MKDMVTNGTGNSRYLKTSLASGTTWESALAMLREGTFPIDLNGLNKGGITQLGSAYSKANVLPDDTCEALGLDPETAEPKDAFEPLLDPIGNIQYTMRDMLGDNWALCNGDSISADKYPELCEVLGMNYLDVSRVDDMAGIGTYGAINCAIYANGYYVLGGAFPVDNTVRAAIAYSTSPNGPWTIVPVWTGTAHMPGSGVYCIAYHDEMWVVGGVGPLSGRSYFARIAYATSLNGPWTIKDLWNNSQATGPVYCITYAGGRWVAGGCQDLTYSYAIIAYATTPSDTWTTKDLWSYDSYRECYIKAIAYADGKYVVAGGGRDSNGGYIGRIAYNSSVSGSWTIKDIPADMTRGLNSINYINGTWIFGTTSGGSLYYTSSLSATPNIAVVTNSSDGNSCISVVRYYNGFWFAFGRRDASLPLIAVSDSLSGPWKCFSPWKGTSTTTDDYGSIVKAVVETSAGLWCYGYYYDTTQRPRAVIISETDGIFDCVLPTITPDDGNAFIKIDKGGF